MIEVWYEDDRASTKVQGDDATGQSPNQILLVLSRRAIDNFGGKGCKTLNTKKLYPNAAGHSSPSDLSWCSLDGFDLSPRYKGDFDRNAAYTRWMLGSKAGSEIST